jgi:hypothetical protein
VLQLATTPYPEIKGSTNFGHSQFVCLVCIVCGFARVLLYFLAFLVSHLRFHFFSFLQLCHLLLTVSMFVACDFIVYYFVALLFATSLFHRLLLRHLLLAILLLVALTFIVFYFVASCVNICCCCSTANFFKVPTSHPSCLLLLLHHLLFVALLFVLLF